MKLATAYFKVKGQFQGQICFFRNEARNKCNTYFWVISIGQSISDIILMI